MSSINVYRLTKMIYQNYCIVFYNSKSKCHIKSFGVDNYNIIWYIKNNNKKIVNLNHYIKYFKNNNINYIVIREENISLIEHFDDIIYLDYYYKAIIYEIMMTIKYRVCI